MGVSKFVLKLRLYKDEQKSHHGLPGKRRVHNNKAWFPPQISFFLAIFYLLLSLGIKEKDTHLAEVLKTSVLFTLILDIQIEMLHQLLCVYSYHMQNYRHLYTIHNLFFSSLFACRCETHIPRKVPEIQHFYEFTRCRQQTVSTCTVPGNISTQQTFSTRYPYFANSTRSRAREVGLQEM